MRLPGIIVVLAFAGCYREHRHDHQTGAYGRLEAKLPGVLEALGRLRESLRAAGDDCGQVAHALRTFAWAHDAMLREISDLVAALDETQRERFAFDHEDDREQLAELFTMTRQRCRGDKDVDAAVDLAGFRNRLWAD